MSKTVEQIPLKNLLANAYEEFNQGLHSTACRFVLWGSFSSKDELVNNFFRAKKKPELLDKRRKNRNSDESNFVNAVEFAADQAMDYVSYARKNNAQPVLREMMVSYCTLFENLLKNVALIYLLAKYKQKGLADQVYVPGDQFKKALLEIKTGWSASNRVYFFKKFIVEKAPYEMVGYFEKEEDSWAIVESAIKLRNAIVHQLARPTEQETIGDVVFAAMQEAELSVPVLTKIKDAMRAIAYPFSPDPLMPL